MKKLILIIAIVLLLAGGQGGIAAAEGTVVVTSELAPGGLTKVIFSFVANAASAATIPAASSSTKWPRSGSNVGCITFVETNPGSPAPTDDYDITLVDQYGLDVMGGELADRDTADTEQAAPKVDGTFMCRTLAAAFTLNVTGNSVNSAVGTVIVYILDL